MSLSEWRNRVAEHAKRNIEFDPHFSLRAMQRNLPIDEIQGHLLKPDKLKSVEVYKEYEHRLIFQLSAKFQLIVGVQFIKKGLYIKTAFRRYRKWTPKIKKL